MENTEKKQPLVQVKNLCKYFEISRKETLKAVDDLTFDIYKGETVSLVGESGCGNNRTYHDQVIQSDFGKCIL